MKVICFFFDVETGGPHRRARSVYRELGRKGFETRIALPPGPGSAADFFAGAGIGVDRLSIRKPCHPRRLAGFLAYLALLPVGALRTRRYLLRERPDIVHVNGAFDLVPALAARLAGVPIVWHLNDTGMPRPVAALLGRAVSRLSTRVVAAASAVGAHHGIAADAAEIVFAPVDTGRFAARDPAGWPRAEPVIGLLANWNPLKGQEHFIEVIARLRAMGLPVRGRIMGRFLDRQEGYWRPLLTRIEAEGLSDAIECVGFVDRPEAEVATLDLLLLTSRSEACPTVVLEAMSVGVPSVCFSVGGVDELIGAGTEAPAGVGVPPGNVGVMADAVARLLADTAAYRAMARAGQARARAHFSLEACVRRHDAVYRASVAAKQGVA